MGAYFAGYKQEAVALLGQTLVREDAGRICSGKIVEVELYHQDDPSSHSFRGMTARNRSMFLPAGNTYVYLSYGIHHCLNISLGKEGEGVAALIRALEPIDGQEYMQQRRGALSSRNVSTSNLCSGPGKLTQALGITLKLDGHNLSSPPLVLRKGAPIPESEIITTKRIGISKATEEPLRFYIKGNPFISRR